MTIRRQSTIAHDDKRYAIFQRPFFVAARDEELTAAIKQSRLRRDDFRVLFHTQPSKHAVEPLASATSGEALANSSSTQAVVSNGISNATFICTAERWYWSRGLMRARKNAVSAKTAFTGA